MSSQYTHKKFKITQPDPNSELGKQDQERINYFQKNKERINQRFDQARQNYLVSLIISHGMLNRLKTVIEKDQKLPPQDIDDLIGSIAEYTTDLRFLY